MIYPKLIEDLISSFKEIPGIGRKGAERIVISLLKWDESKLSNFGEEILSVAKSIKRCSVCGNIAENDLCSICTGIGRDSSIICIVEDFSQISTMESALFKGHYHILGGKISPLDGITPEKLNISSLINRLENSNDIKEVIVAISQDIEGQATTVYLAKLLAEHGIKVTTLARGIPAGADISFANSATLSAALNGRYQV